MRRLKPTCGHWFFCVIDPAFFCVLLLWPCWVKLALVHRATVGDFPYAFPPPPFFGGHSRLVRAFCFLLLSASCFCLFLQRWSAFELASWALCPFALLRLVVVSL